MAYNYLALRPFVTVPQFVNNPVNQVKVLFVTENYPKNMNHVLNNTCLYRSIQHANIKFNPNENQLLNNLSNAMGIKNPNNESKLLDEFMNISNYYVIDTYQHGQKWTKKTRLCGTLDQITEDINYLNPEQVIFCYERSNSVIFKRINGKINPSIKIIRPIDGSGNVTGNVFKSPTGQWFHTHNYKNGKTILGFRDQIELVLKRGILTA